MGSPLMAGLILNIGINPLNTSHGQRPQWQLLLQLPANDNSVCRYLRAARDKNVLDDLAFIIYKTQLKSYLENR